MCYRREYRVTEEGIVEARNVDIHGFSHCVYSQTEPRGGTGRWYPYTGYYKYHRQELVFPPKRLDEKVAIGDNLEALLPVEGEYTIRAGIFPLEQRETMTLQEWLACMGVEYSTDFLG